jgi:hypothetical protein
MKKMIVIGGELQNGKDTCAEFISQYIQGQGLTASKISLATELRRHIETYFSPLFASLTEKIEDLEKQMQFFDNTPWVSKEPFLAKLQEIKTTKAQIWGDKNFISRMVHQGLGECIRNEVDSTYWVRRLLANMDRSSDVVIVPDMRWSSDGYFLMDTLSGVYDITFIKVKNLNKTHPNMSNKTDIRISQNSSENSLYDFENFSYHLEANNLQELKESSFKIAEEILNDEASV